MTMKQSSEMQSDIVFVLNSSNLPLVSITRTLLGLSDESIGRVWKPNFSTHGSPFSAKNYSSTMPKSKVD